MFAPKSLKLPRLVVPLALLGALVTTAACSSSKKSPATAPSASSSTTASTSGSQPVGIAAQPGYQVTVFAKSVGTYSNPDSIEIADRNVFVDFQNVTAKDGADHKTSTIVEYATNGSVKATWPAIGHSDGLRMDPTTHKLWALSDEDANPMLTVIDPATGKSSHYTFAKTAHGGGYDDIVFMGGAIYMTASNPNIVNNANTAPAVVKASLNDASKTVAVTPILMGNATAGDGNGAKVTINMIDPDSMFINPAGDLTVDNQAGMALITIHNPGPSQVVTQTSVGTAVDDTVYEPKSAGKLLVSDTTGNIIYAITDTQSRGKTYVATPNDSGVAGFVGTLAGGNPGIITPAIIGFLSPHGMGFLPGS